MYLSFIYLFIYTYIYIYIYYYYFGTTICKVHQVCTRKVFPISRIAAMASWGVLESYTSGITPGLSTVGVKGIWGGRGELAGHLAGGFQAPACQSCLAGLYVHFS